MFHVDQRPKSTGDLDRIEISTTELMIHGKTKNITKLKSLSNLEKLWVYTVNQEEFDTIIGLVNPQFLYVKEMRVEDLSSLESLSNIETLELEWNPKASRLWDITKNTSLKSLTIIDFKRLNDIRNIQRCKKLESLHLEGGIWNTLKLNTLEPLKHLSNLKYLFLSNISAKDESLEPVSQLTGLQELKISNQFPTEEYARLSVTLPNTQCEYFQPYIYLSNSIDDKDIMVIGKRKPLLNSKVDMKRMKKYEEQFKSLQDKYRDL
ncbi:hypothetical protein [Ectobacillus panaciterrae]|uniref:hypothetical protein n=1 Tax=Ectobacillus panaciterrae TaxID=363872 RepID=UPI0003FE33EB|nr:hypothetical protein [Ectobacillus panaciterrae]